MVDHSNNKSSNGNGGGSGGGNGGGVKLSYAGSAFTVCDEGLLNSTLLEPTKSRSNYLRESRDSRKESPTNKQVSTGLRLDTLSP